MNLCEIVLESANQHLVRDSIERWRATFTSLSGTPVFGVFRWLEGDSAYTADRLNDCVHCQEGMGAGRIFEDERELFLETYTGKRFLALSKSEGIYRITVSLWDRPSGEGECGIKPVAEWAAEYDLATVKTVALSNGFFSGDEARKKLREFVRFHTERMSEVAI